MHFLKTILLSIIFWQLTASPVVYAEAQDMGLKNAINYFNAKNYKGSELILSIKDYDVKIYNDITEFLQKNEVLDLNTIPTGLITQISNNQFKITIEKMDLVVTLVDKDFFKIAL